MLCFATATERQNVRHRRPGPHGARGALLNEVTRACSAVCSCFCVSAGEKYLCVACLDGECRRLRASACMTLRSAQSPHGDCAAAHNRHLTPGECRSTAKRFTPGLGLGGAGSTWRPSYLYVPLARALHSRVSVLLRAYYRAPMQPHFMCTCVDSVPPHCASAFRVCVHAALVHSALVPFALGPLPFGPLRACALGPLPLCTPHLCPSHWCT
jgi:hypothetical protein